MRAMFTIVAVGLTLASACGGPKPAARSDDAAPVVGAAAWPDVGAFEPSTAGADDVAVIVAIEDYAFLPDVEGATRNASDWERYFRARGMQRVYYLGNSDAPAEEIRRFASEAAAAAKPGATVWFVFIGHGAPAPDGSDGVLVGMDAQQNPTSLAARGVRRGELLAALEKGRQARTVVVLDACFSGRDSSGDALAQGTQPVVAVDTLPRSDASTVVLGAAKSDQFAGALPNAARPAFSYLLLGALRGWADDGDGNVTAAEAHEWVTRQLRHVKGRSQTPSLSGSADVVLAADAREADPGIADRISGRVVASAPSPGSGTEAGPKIDTDAGVKVVQPTGWTPAPAELDREVLRIRGPVGGAMISLFAWRVRQFAGGEEFGAYHDGLQKEHQQLRAPRGFQYGDNTGAESEYATLQDGTEVRLILWERYGDGGYWRVMLGVPAENRDAVYRDFQAFLTSFEFDGKMAPTWGVPQDPTPDKYAVKRGDYVNTGRGIAIRPPSGWTRKASEETKKTVVLFEHPQGSSILVYKTSYADGLAAVEAAHAEHDEMAREHEELTAPSKMTVGVNSGSFSEYRVRIADSTGSVKGVSHVRLARFQRILGADLWQVVLIANESIRDQHQIQFLQFIADLRWN